MCVCDAGHCYGPSKIAKLAVGGESGTPREGPSGYNWSGYREKCSLFTGLSSNIKLPFSISALHFSL